MSDDMATSMETMERVDQKLAALRAEVERFLKKPGCNVPQRQHAMARLMWALEESKK